MFVGVHMPTESFGQPARDGDTSRLNEQRSDLIYWIVGQFHVLLAEGKDEDGHAFMDEWFEWIDKKSYINESTLFFDGDELNELYEQSKS